MAPPMSWVCSDCGRAFSEKGNWKKHVTSQKCKGYTKTTEQDIELFEEPKEEDMFKYVFDKDDVRWAECNLCDSIIRVGTSKHANTGKFTAVRHFKTCHVPELKKWKCTDCKVAFVVRKSTTGYGHSGECPERAGRAEEKKTKPWLRDWNDKTKAFTIVRESNAELPYDLRPIKPKKHNFIPVARKRATPSGSSSAPKRGRGSTRGRGRRRQPARKSSSESSEALQTSSDEESPPVSAAATSSEEFEASEQESIGEHRHSRSLVVKLKLSQEKLKSIVDEKVGHEVVTDSGSEYEVPKKKNLRRVSKNGPTRANVVKASTDISSPPRQPTTAPSQNSSFFLERGYTPPRQSPRRSRSPTPSEDLHNDPGYFNEAFHVSSSDSDE